MKNIVGFLLALIATSALAQSVPNGGPIVLGQVWTVPQWNTAWQTKTDAINGALSFNFANGNASVGSSFNAGNSASVNVNNTAVGQFSLNSGSNASSMTDNTAVGVNTLRSLTTNGCCETAVGKWALQNDINGKFNTSVGSDTMRFFTGGGGTATGNTALGHGSMGGDDTTPASNTASGNTTLGAWSGQEITSGSGNTCVGDSACVDLTTGQFNVAIGFYAVGACTTFDTAGTPCANATFNVGIGTRALQNTQTLGQTAVGHNSMQFLTTQVNNTALGYQTLSSSATTNDNNNTAIGYNALNALNGASDVTAVGSLAGGTMTIGTGNTLIGSHAGTAVTTGTYNTLIGVFAGQTITTGTNNLLITAGAPGTVTMPSPSTGQWLNIQNVIAGSMIAKVAGTSLSSCGTTPQLNAQATELNGTITTGTGSLTSCTFSFSVAHTAAPSCVITARSGTPFPYAVSTTNFVITTAATNATFDYHCSGF